MQEDISLAKAALYKPISGNSSSIRRQTPTTKSHWADETWKQSLCIFQLATHGHDQLHQIRFQLTKGLPKCVHDLRPSSFFIHFQLNVYIWFIDNNTTRKFTEWGVMIGTPGFGCSVKHESIPMPTKLNPTWPVLDRVIFATATWSYSCRSRNTVFHTTWMYACVLDESQSEFA